jgi:hypothetical protein
MQLIVQPAAAIGQYTWQIIYGDSATDNRPYILKPIDTANGHWVIDETDGIVLDSYVFNNSIKGAFTVMNNTIIDNYTVENNKMTVEFFSINLSKKNTSGKGTAAVPFVDSYTIGSFQTGVLYRVAVYLYLQINMIGLYSFAKKYSGMVVKICYIIGSVKLYLPLLAT